jgi:Raf kinase inhibitor-like YbhB/YbcL family protein
MKALGLVFVVFIVIVAVFFSAGCSGTGNGQPAITQPVPPGKGTVTVSETIVVHVKTTSPPAPVSTTPVSLATPGITLPPSAGSDNFSFRVDGITSGSVLPDEYGCGKKTGKSPDLSWQNVPAGTRSLVVIVEDPDATGGKFTHWILYNIHPDQNLIGPARPNIQVLLDGTMQGINSGGSFGYYPACPPFGPQHRYIFTIYAIDSEISTPVGETLNRQGMDRLMSGHVISQVDIITTFKA